VVAVTERATSAIVATTIAIGIVMVAITVAVIIRFAWAVVVTMSTMSETGVSA